MREAYTGREVSVSALRVLLDQIQDAQGRATVEQLIPTGATRVSWQVMCEILDQTIPSTADAHKLGIDAVATNAYKFGRRLRFVNRFLNLEQLLRFAIYPRNPIDFACVSHAVSSSPGRVDLVLYINSRYRPSEKFFSAMHGAAQEMLRRMQLADAHVQLQIHDSQAHLTFTYIERAGLVYRVESAIGRIIGWFLLRRLAIRGYPDLVAGRKMFEEQLVERAKLEDQLQLAQRDFNSRIEHVDDLIVEINSAGDLVYISPNVKRLINLEDSASAEDFSRVVHSADLQRVTNSIEMALHDTAVSHLDDFRITDAQGRVRWVELKLRRTGHTDNRIIGVGRDVTERRQRHLDQITLERQLETIQRSEALGVLSAGIAHQFNNLLVPIIGDAELAELELSADSKVHARLQRILTAAGNAAELVRQISVYSGGAGANLRIIDLGQEVRELLDLASARVPSRIEIVADLVEGAFVEGDASQLQQLIMNLVTNAAEAIGDDRGKIEVSITTDAFRVLLTVGDNGTGMDERVKARAFEPFYTTKFTGRGLGLAAVMGIARVHNGEIAVQSAAGVGTKVTLSLVATSDRAVVHAPAVEFTARFSGRALVVDDDAAVLAVSKALMENLGFDVDTAVDGAQALEKMVDHKYSIALVDLVMPRLDGREVLMAIRQQMPTLPVIILSGYGNTTMDIEFANDPATRFLRKPYRIDQLGKTLWSLSDLIEPVEMQKTLSQ